MEWHLKTAAGVDLADVQAQLVLGRDRGAAADAHHCPQGMNGYLGALQTWSNASNDAGWPEFDGKYINNPRFKTEWGDSLVARSHKDKSICGRSSS